MSRLHVDLRDALQFDKKPDGLLHPVGRSQKTVVTKDHGTMASHGRGNPLPPIGILDLDLFVVENRVVLEEDARLLGNGLDGPDLGRKGRALWRVDMGSAHRLGTRHQDRVMDEIGRSIDGPRPFCDLPVGIHHHQV